MRKGLKWLYSLAVAGILVFLLRTFLFSSCTIPSSGMENSLLPGDRVIINKWSYGFRTNSLGFSARWREKEVTKNDIVLFNNPKNSSLPLPKKEHFISRCIGVPGDTLWVDSLFTAQELTQGLHPDYKQLYTFRLEQKPLLDSILSLLQIETSSIKHNSPHQVVLSRYEYYLTQQKSDHTLALTPIQKTRQLYPLVIPRAGDSITITPFNQTLLRNTLLIHENQEVAIINNQFYLNKKPVTKVSFQKEYFWVGSNTMENIMDSRFFGFVPKDHIIGKASFIWFSKRTTPPGTIRWNRILKLVN